MRVCAASMAGIEDDPGSARPSASTIEVMVEAVPIVLQVPGVLVIRPSRLCISLASILPAWYSSQNMRVWVPAPTVLAVPFFR